MALFYYDKEQISVLENDAPAAGWSRRILRHPGGQNRSGRLFCCFFPRAAKKSTAEGGGGERACKKKKIKKKKKKSRSSEMTAGLFLRSELNEHRV